MPRLLILNCDDFGQSPAANDAIIHLLQERRVSSTTIMATAPAFEEAAAWAKQHPEASIGVHLTFTSEYEALRFRSLTGDPSLHDESGYMYRTVEEFERGSHTKAVVREMRAQFEAVRRAGIQVTHADNHMGSLYGVATGKSYLPQVFWQCSLRGLPFRLFRYIEPSEELTATYPAVADALAKAIALSDTLGVAVPDYLLSHPYGIVPGETYELFKAMMIDKMYRLPEGVSETFIHPAVPDTQLEASIPSWEKRVWEYHLMLDDDFAYALRDAQIVLTDYRYVKKHLQRPRLPAAWRLLKLALGVK